MIKKMKFRQKMLLSQIGLFLSFILLSIPFIEKAVVKVQLQAFNASALDMVDELKESKSESQMMEKVRSMAVDVFYHVILFDDKARILSEFNIGATEKNAGLLQASQEVARESLPFPPPGSITDTFILDDTWVVASAFFEFNNKTYGVQGIFPYHPLENFTTAFNLWLVCLLFVALVIFAIFTWIIFTMLHRPIHQIISAIRAYQGGRKDLMIDILNNADFSNDQDFGRLADTVLALHKQVQTQLLALTEARNEKESILETLIEGVIAVDGNLKVSYVNFVAAKMLNLSKKDLLSTHFPSSMEGKNTELLSACKRLLVACQKHKGVVTDSIEVEQGKKMHLDLIAAPKSDARGAIIVMQDNSSQHKVYEMGKDFVANASHELRTPITIIKGFAETLHDMKDIPYEMLTGIVEKIVRNCERMENLIKNLLTLADIENLSISPHQSCDLVTLIHNCLEMLRAVYPDTQIEFTTDLSELIATADVNILELAVMNLLTNAAKYSKKPAKIHVILSEDEDEACIVIQDQGIGIPATDVDRIFDRFYTVDKTHSRKLGGAGLGLSLVKTIIDKHHGKISVESTVGVGTKFTILIPVSSHG